MYNCVLKTKDTNTPKMVTNIFLLTLDGTKHSALQSPPFAVENDVRFSKVEVLSRSNEIRLNVRIDAACDSLQCFLNV